MARHYITSENGGCIENQDFLETGNDSHSKPRHSGDVHRLSVTMRAESTLSHFGLQPQTFSVFPWHHFQLYM